MIGLINDHFVESLESLTNGTKYLSTNILSYNSMLGCLLKALL